MNITKWESLSFRAPFPVQANRFEWVNGVRWYDDNHVCPCVQKIESLIWHTHIQACKHDFCWPTVYCQIVEFEHTVSQYWMRSSHIHLTWWKIFSRFSLLRPSIKINLRYSLNVVRAINFWSRKGAPQCLNTMQVCENSQIWDLPIWCHTALVKSYMFYSNTYILTPIWPG